MIGVLHTARINAIKFIVSSDKLIKMVNFMSSRSSVDRVPAQCSEGHGHSHFIVELKIHCLY